MTTTQTTTTQTTQTTTMQTTQMTSSIELGIELDFHDRNMLKALQAAVKKQLKGSSTAYMREKLRCAFPHYRGLIEGITKIRPYFNDVATGQITEPVIILDTGDVITYSFIMFPKATPNSSQRHYLFCRAIDFETQQPPDDCEELQQFGLDIYRFLIDFDLNY